jgi:uncharacterized protein YggE
MKHGHMMIAVLVILAAAGAPVQCQTNQNERTIVVETFGEVQVWPDLARLQYRIQKENMLASRALEDCRQEAKRFADTLKKTELDKIAVIEESGVVIASKNDPYRQPQSSLPSGFSATKDYILSFPIQEKENVDAVLQQVVKVVDTLNPEGFTPQVSQDRGMYEMGPSVVQFVVTNTERFDEQGLQEAIQKNRPEAERKAKLMNVKIVQIRNSSFNNNSYMSMGRYQARQKANEILGSTYQEYPVRTTYNVTYVVEENQ